jgi:acyl-CoA thioesterase FadM
MLVCKQIGTKSFTLDYKVVVMENDQEVIVSTGSSVLVSFNHAEQKTVPVPEEWRAMFEKLPSVTS